MPMKSKLIKRILTDEIVGEAIPGQPLVEIYGQRRVLIEHHKGVVRYNCDEIEVSTGKGIVCICGCHLQIATISKEQLVIIGEIQCVKLIRGNCL